MKKLELSNCNFEKLSMAEMKTTTGGGWWWTIIKQAFTYANEIGGAMIQVKEEGGTLCTDMPFK